MCRCVLDLQKYFINMMVLYLQHGLGVWQLLPLVYFDVCLKSNIRKCEFNRSDFNIYQITILFFLTLKYSSRPLQVILLPLISFMSMFWGLRSHGTRTFRLFRKSPSISG